MEAMHVTVDRGEARRLYREYKKHQAYSAPIDWEVQRTYQLLAQGKVIIRAIESIRAAGLYAEGPNAGLPKLALCRADAPTCFYQAERGGGGAFTMSTRWGEERHLRQRIALPPGTFPEQKERSRWSAAEAKLPLIPLHLRPQRGLANYHVLWEAEWTRIVPRDPFLLRRIGKADLWLVVAHWELSEVERGALATRIAVQ